MALYYQDGQRGKIKKVVETNENYSIVHMSTSRKKSDFEKQSDAKKLKELPEGSKLAFLYKGDYAHSDWGFVRFVGKAHTALSGFAAGDIITFKGFEKQEPYASEEGEVVNPKNTQRFVFDCEIYRSTTGGATATKKPAHVELPSEDDIPF